jgi:hypothetical protein
MSEDIFDKEELLEELDGDGEFLEESVEMLNEDSTGLLDRVRSIRRINAPFPSSTEYFEGIKQSSTDASRGVGYNRASGAGRNSALRRDFQTVSSDGTTATVPRRRCQSKIRPGTFCLARFYGVFAQSLGDGTNSAALASR